MNFKFKVGEKVVVRHDLNKDTLYGKKNWRANNDAILLAGKLCTISLRRYDSEFGNYYYLEEGDEELAFMENMCVKVR